MWVMTEDTGAGIHPENPCTNILVYFPDCPSPEYSAQPAALPFLNLRTQKISSKICTGTSRTDYWSGGISKSRTDRKTVWAVDQGSALINVSLGTIPWLKLQ